jgi:Flp pilus assembly protein TadD
MSHSTTKSLTELHRPETLQVDACCVAALEALERGDVSGAVTWAERCGALPDALSDARYAAVRGMIAASAGRFAEAVEHFRVAVRLNPYEIAFARRLVELLQTEGQLDEAVNVLESLARKDPKQADIWVDLGYARLATGNQAGARKALERAAALRPNDHNVLFALAQMYEATQEPARAVEVLSASMGRELSPRLLNELARLLLHLNRYADAEARFRELREKDTAAYLLAQHGISLCRMKRGNWRGALEAALDASLLDCYGVTTKFLAYAKDRVFGNPEAASQTETELLQNLCQEMDEYAEQHGSESIAA